MPSGRVSKNTQLPQNSGTLPEGPSTPALRPPPPRPADDPKAPAFSAGGVGGDSKPCSESDRPQGDQNVRSSLSHLQRVCFQSRHRQPWFGGRVAVFSK